MKGTRNHEENGVSGQFEKGEGDFAHTKAQRYLLIAEVAEDAPQRGAENAEKNAGWGMAQLFAVIFVQLK